MSRCKRDYSKVLIVEGPDDKHAVISLMKAYTAWPDHPPWPLFVECAGGAESLLAERYLRNELRASNRLTTGVVIDADASAIGRYVRLRQLCDEQFPNLPATPPPGGLVTRRDGGQRLGLWIMPDNRGAGGLEAFLSGLVTEQQSGLWTYSAECVDQAIARGASCRVPHKGKARLHTWLAWQDPPGRSAGIALSQGVLDPRASPAAAFVAWFKELFELP